HFHLPRPKLRKHRLQTHEPTRTGRSHRTHPHGYATPRKRPPTRKLRLRNRQPRHHHRPQSPTKPPITPPTHKPTHPQTHPPTNPQTHAPRSGGLCPLRSAFVVLAQGLCPWVGSLQTTQHLYPPRRK